MQFCVITITLEVKTRWFGRIDGKVGEKNVRNIQNIHVEGGAGQTRSVGKLEAEREAENGLSESTPKEFD